MKTKILTFLPVLVASVGFAQNFEQLQKAFSDSYAYEKQGDFKKAADVLKKVYDADSYEINLRLGWLSYNAGQFNESLSYYNKALSLRPLSEEARFGLVLPASALGKWTLVENTYKEILKHSPGNTVALYRLGLIYYGRKDYTTAQSYFQKVVDLYPFSYDGLLMLAWTKLQLGKKAEAKALFQKVLLLSPGDKSAMEGLSYLK